MDESSARTILETLRAERTDAEAAAAEASRRVGALGKVIEGYLELFPALASAESDRTDSADREPTAAPSEGAAETDGTTGPKGGEAILRVMSDQRFHRKYWTVAAMTHELEVRGWLPQSDVPANAVRAALRRVSDHERRVSRGTGLNGALVYYFSATADDRPTFAGDRPRLERRATPPPAQETLTELPSVPIVPSVNGSTDASTQEAPMTT